MDNSYSYASLLEELHALARTQDPVRPGQICPSPSSSTKDNKRVGTDAAAQGFDPDRYAKQFRPAGWLTCPNAYRMLCRHLSRTQDLLSLRPPCRSWTCHACVPWMLHRLGRHYLRCLASVSGVLFLGDVPTQHWNTVQRRLQRAGASYLWVGLPGVRRLFSVADVRRAGKDDWRTDTVTPRQACLALTDTLKAMPVRVVARPGLPPMDASRDWQPPPQRKEKEWALAGYIHCDRPERILAVLEEYGIPANVKKDFGGFVVRFRLPDGIDESEATALIARLRTVR